MIQIRAHVETLPKEYKDLYDEYVANVESIQLGKKTTICLVTLKNGFEVVGTSACIDPSDFVVELGMKYALEDAMRKVDELTAYHRQALL